MTTGNAEKSPLRIASVGTVNVFVDGVVWRSPS
jgi:hypothetical protein